MGEESIREKRTRPREYKNEPEFDTMSIILAVAGSMVVHSVPGSAYITWSAPYMCSKAICKDTVANDWSKQWSTYEAKCVVCLDTNKQRSQAEFDRLRKKWQGLTYDEYWNGVGARGGDNSGGDNSRRKRQTIRKNDEATCHTSWSDLFCLTKRRRLSPTRRDGERRRRLSPILRELEKEILRHS